MSDELIKQLRDVRLEGVEELCWKAADRIEKLENSLAWYQMMDAMCSDHVVELTDKLEAAEAKLTECEARLSKAVEALRWYDNGFISSKGREVLAELEGK